jgi:hypothetical protein
MQLPEIPQLVYEAMTELKQLGNYNRQNASTITQLQSEIQKTNQRTKYARWGGTTLLLALLLTLLPGMEINQWPEIPPGSWILGGIGFFWLFLKN